MNTFKISTIITAGGTSSRFGGNKLLEKIGSKTVLETSIEKFLPYCDEIIIPAGGEIQKNIKFNDKKIKYTKNGNTRQESVFLGLSACSNPDFVLIHDGARPFIDEEIIKKMIENVTQKNAVIVAVKAIDTIKICDDNGKIISTPPRKNVYHAQTPQAFDFKTIYDAHKKLRGQNYTDDSSMLEFLGIDVFIVDGNYANKKITIREDLKN